MGLALAIALASMDGQPHARPLVWLDATDGSQVVSGGSVASCVNRGTLGGTFQRGTNAQVAGQGVGPQFSSMALGGTAPGYVFTSANATTLKYQFATPLSTVGTPSLVVMCLMQQTLPLALNTTAALGDSGALANANPGIYLDWGVSNGQQVMEVDYYDDAFSFTGYADSGPLVTQSPYVLTAIVTAAATVLRANGAQVGSNANSASTTFTVDQAVIGATPDSYAITVPQYADAIVSQYLIFQGPLSAVDIAYWEGVLLSKQGAYQMEVSVKTYGATGNGTTDDSAAFQAGLNALAGTGTALYVPPGVYKIGTTLNPPSNTTIVGSQGATIAMAMTYTGTQSHCFLEALHSANIATGTLNSTPTIGSSTMSLTIGTKPAVGQALIVQDSSGNSVATYDVIASPSGSSPYTVTVDRPILMPFVSTNVVALVANYPHDITVLGNGMQVTGTGDRVTQFPYTLRGYVEDTHYVGISGSVLGDTAFSFDVGSRECAFVRCSADMTGSGGSVIGMMLESNERSYMEACNVRNAGGTGIQMPDCVESALYDCHAYGCVTGIGIGSTGALGAIDSSMIGCTSSGGTNGISVGLSVRSKVVACSATDCATNGLSVTASGTLDATWTNCSAVRAGNGISLGSGPKRTYFSNVNLSMCTATYVTASDDLIIDGLIAEGLTAVANAIVTGGSMTRISNFEVQSANTINAFNPSGTLTVLENGRVTMIHDSEAVNLAAGVLRMRNVTVAATGGSTIGVNAATGTTVREDACDLESCATKFALAGSAVTNRGTVVANGATGVVIAWPDLKTTDLVTLSMHTKGGAPTAMPLITYNPGTGFTVTSYAGDTSTYDYLVS